MASGASQILNYRIFHCSSQDPSFPVGELLNISKDQEPVGWQSQRFCVYPQEIVLQFPCLIHLKQVQFLLHQSKIPSRIELFAYAPDFSPSGAQANLLSPHNANISFQRLGHFSLDDNIRTNYQARELKTVYLEQYCQYLKIILNKNHLNSQNIFNQVGLISITCQGSYIGEYETQAMQRGGQPATAIQEGALLVPRNLKISGVNEEELDATVQDKIRVLNQAKLQAVEEENFDKAKILKDAIDKLKMAGFQLTQLEAQKKLAIENEDFDSAKVLKFEIERLRNMAMNLDTDRVILTPIQQQRTFNSQQMRGGPPVQESYDRFDDAEETMNNREEAEQPYTGRMVDPHNDQQQYYALEESKIQVHDGLDPRMSLQEEAQFQSSLRQENPLNNSQRHLPNTMSKQQLAAVATSKASIRTQSNEDQVVPALNMKKVIDFNTVGDDDYDGGKSDISKQISDNGGVSMSQDDLKLSSIPQSQKPIADAVVPLFGEQTACMVFARSWGNREKGIQEVITHLDEVLSKDSETPSHNTILQLMAECLKDKVQQVATKSFQLVDAYILALQRYKQVSPKSDISNTEKMLIQLLDRLADPKFSQKAEQCFFQLFQVEQYDGNFLISFLLKNSSFVNKNMATSFKHAVPRLQIINSILSDFPKYEQQLKKTSAQTFPLPPLIAKIKEGIDASNPDHRKICLQIIVTLYNQFGFKRVETLIGELPLKCLEVLAKDIPEADAYSKAKKHQPTKKE